MKPHPILSIMNPLTRALAKASRYAFALSAFALGTHADTLTIDGDLDVEGTATIQESLLVRGDGGVLFEGEGPSFGWPPTSGSGSIPTEGPATRMMWYPAKAAFRAGSVTGTQWDDTNVGFYSVAFGSGTRASGHYSTAMGDWTSASGESSTAMGAYTSASGVNSTAMGTDTLAVGSSSVAMGNETAAMGSCSTAMGGLTVAGGHYSTVMGQGTSSLSYASLAIGRRNIADGNSTQWVYADPLFEIGNGDWSVPSNALTVLKNGRTTIQNKFWDNQDPMAVPTSSDASDGEALVVKGHSRFEGRVSITYIQPAGDISMGPFTAD